MPNDIQLKRSSVAGRVPDAANVLVGEPVVNLADRVLYTKNTNGNVIVIGAGTTSNITEGTNLYFSNARVYANVAPLLTGAGSNVTVSASPPGSPKVGDTWINSDTGKKFLYINDGTSSQWVEDIATYVSVGSTGTAAIGNTLAIALFFR